MKSFAQNIYPLNEANLNALLNHYFHFLEPVDSSELLSEIKGFSFSLAELEHLAVKILPYLTYITEAIGKPPSQSNLLSFAIECFANINIDYTRYSPDRIRIIQSIQHKSGISVPYEQTPPGISHLFIYNYWN